MSLHERSVGDSHLLRCRGLFGICWLVVKDFHGGQVFREARMGEDNIPLLVHLQKGMEGSKWPRIKLSDG